MLDPQRLGGGLNFSTLDDPTPDYMNLLGMIFSMYSMMLKLKWCA